MTLPDSRAGSAIATDDDGMLYNERLRGLLGEDLAPEVRAVAEAFAAIGQAARLSHWAMERWASRYGLSEARLQVLLILRQQDAMPLARLAEAMEITRPSLTGLIDHLEADGLVSRRPDRHDRRSVIATLTPQGLDRANQIWSRRLEQQVGITEGVTVPELIQLRHLCLRMVGNLRASTTAAAQLGRDDPPADVLPATDAVPEGPGGRRRRRAR